MARLSGIYKITNNANGKIYVGSAVNFKIRKSNHFYRLKKGNHCNIKLQSAYNKYGKSFFSFEILATCPVEYLIKLEQFFIDSLNPFYNIARVANSSLGRVHSEETRQKMSLSRMGRVFSEETREKISTALKGKKQGRRSNTKPVLCITNGKTYEAGRDASNELGLQYQLVSKCLTGVRNSTGGYKFRYA